MCEQELRPPVWVGQVLLETVRLAEMAEFMGQLGMRPIIQRPEVAVLELRGGPHLVLIAKREGIATHRLDLMVDDLGETHKRFTEGGLAPTAIERVSPDHEGFTSPSQPDMSSCSIQIMFPVDPYSQLRG